MTFGAILALIALTAFLGVLPVWPWSRRLGGRPAIVAGICLAAIVIFIALGAV